MGQQSNSSGLRKMKFLTAAYTPIQSDAGTTFLCDAAGQAITLGLASSFEIGTWFKFIASETLTGSWVITCAGANFHGQVQGSGIDDVATGTSGGTAETVVTIVTAAAENGDFVEMFTDGTWWYINGQCELAANITVA
jgi:hypothetical protein